MRNLDAFTDAAHRAVAVWRKRQIRPVIDGMITDLEWSLSEFASSWFPVRRPSRRSPEYDNLRPLMIWEPWSLRFQGQPVIQSYGCRADEFVDALRQFFGAPHASELQIVGRLAEALELIRLYRGRGYRYGLMRNGVCVAIVQEVAASPLAERLATGRAEARARLLLKTAERELQISVGRCTENELDFLRLIHAKYCEEQVPDGAFRTLLAVRHGADGLEALDILTGFPYGPIGWFKPFGWPELPSWRSLSAIALGIAPTGPNCSNG